MYWKMPWNRNAEQLMFSVLFPPELNVVGNFHSAKEPVMVLCNGALARAQINWSSISFLLWASTVCENTHFPRSSPVMFSLLSKCQMQLCQCCHWCILGLSSEGSWGKGQAKYWTGMGDVEEVKIPTMITWMESGRSRNGQWILLPSQEPLPAFSSRLYCPVLWLLLCSSGLAAGQSLSQMPSLPEVLTGLCLQVLL